MKKFHLFLSFLTLTFVAFTACTDSESNECDYTVASNLTNGSEIPTEGSVYTVTVRGSYPNMLIQAFDMTNNEIIDQKSINGSSTTANVTLTVDENTSSTSRTVQLRYSVNGGSSWTNINNGTQATSFNYGVESTLVDASDIAPDGASYTVTVKGGHPALLLRAFDFTNQMMIGNTVSVGASTADATETLNIENNITGAERTVELQYSSDEGQTWKTINFGKQANAFTVTSDLTDGTAISPTGATYTLTVTGPHPVIEFRAYDATNQIVLGTADIVAGTTDATADLTIDNNITGASRDIQLQYSVDESKTWITVNSGTQANAFTVTSNLTEGATIAPTGESYTVTATGPHPIILLQALDQTNQVLISTTTITAATTDETATLIVDDNFTGEPRTVELQYSIDQGNTWTKINSGTQQNAFAVTTDFDNGTVVPATGDTYDVTVNGTYPNIPVRAWDNTNEVELDEQTISAGSGAETGALDITENNSGVNRVILIQYQVTIGDSQKWITLASGSQPSI